MKNKKRITNYKDLVAGNIYVRNGRTFSVLSIYLGKFSNSIYFYDIVNLELVNNISIANMFIQNVFAMPLQEFRLFCCDVNSKNNTLDLKYLDVLEEIELYSIDIKVDRTEILKWYNKNRLINQNLPQLG